MDQIVAAGIRPFCATQMTGHLQAEHCKTNVSQTSFELFKCAVMVVGTCRVHVHFKKFMPLEHRSAYNSASSISLERYKLLRHCSFQELLNQYSQELVFLL